MANIQIGPDGGNVPKVKANSYRKLLGLGEGVQSDEFWMTFEGDTAALGIKYLVQITQFPALARENIESYGPLGVQFNQQGRYKNAQDLPITFKEVISGNVYQFVRDWVRNKLYKKVILKVAGESYWAGDKAKNMYLIMEDCWLELDGVDLSVEDGTSLMRPSGTLHANWLSYCNGTKSSTSTDTTSTDNGTGGDEE